MQPHYDVAVIGGSYSGAATALLLKRECPDLRVVIIERSAHFDRKVGEATTEVSGYFLTKRLNLSHHLCHHHVVKSGLRFWFAKTADDSFESCGETGGFYQSRLPTFQVDRMVLDEHILAEAAALGVEVLRPARLLDVDFTPDAPTSLTVETNGQATTRTTRWIVDASGRATLLARKFRTLRKVPDHPTNSVWARFRNVKDWDGNDLRSRFPQYANSCQSARATSTNHLTGYGWWCWIIPLRGGDYSAGLVYDSRLFTLPPGPSLSQRLHTHLLGHPVGREIFGNAEAIKGDTKAFSSLPYFVDKTAGPGWHIVGDASGFQDPLYSPGLDFCSWSVSAAVERITKEHRGESFDIEDLNARFFRSCHGWFESIYIDKYHYLGDQELMTAAILMDIGLYFFGPVRTVVQDPDGGFRRFPFDGPVDGKIIRPLMTFYNRRLALIARKRKAAGVYGKNNLHTRTLVKGFEPSAKVWRVIAQGARIWLRAELRSAFLPKPPPVQEAPAHLTPL